MQQPFNLTSQGTQVNTLQQNRVLRNTYLLLALSMLPTVLGAMISVQMRFSFFAGSPLVSFLLFLGIAFAFMWGIERTKHSAMGVVLMLGLPSLWG